jgi:hypothetical protein
MSVNSFDNYFHEEKYRFLVVQAFDESYEFNLIREDEHASALKIIHGDNNFIANG